MGQEAGHDSLLAAAGRPPARSGAAAVLIAMCLGSMLTMFNSTMVNVTLPDMARSLHASPTGLQWVSTIYTLCYAAMLLPGGALSNQLGRRQAFLAGVVVFVAGTVGCWLAPGLPVLLAARVIQALGAAVLLPQTLSVLVHEYEDPAARARAVGIWAGLASLGLAAGPVLGGVIVSVSSWRWGFTVSVILGVVTWLLACATVPRARHGRAQDAPPVDVTGAAVSVVALAALVYGLIESAVLGWGSPLIEAAFAVAVIGVAGFLRYEHALARRGLHPVMPLGIWRSRRLVAANVAGLAYFVCFYGVLYFFSVDLQQQRGFSVLAAGVAFLPMMGVLTVLGPIAGRLSARFGPIVVLIAGLVTGAVGCLLLALLPAHAALADIEWRLLVVGIGSGFMSSPTSNLAVSSVQPRLSSTASAMHNMCRQLGAVLGVAALGSIVNATAFTTGLDRAMTVVAILLAAVAALVWALTRRPAPAVATP